MPMKKPFILFFFILLLASLACNALTQTSATPTPYFVITEPVIPATKPNLPASEADVPRVELERAAVALAAGEAIFVDVRSPQSFAASHIKGAINIPLGEFETNIANIPLDKEQWIITYCT